MGRVKSPSKAELNSLRQVECGKEEKHRDMG